MALSKIPATSGTEDEPFVMLNSVNVVFRNFGSTPTNEDELPTTMSCGKDNFGLLQGHGFANCFLHNLLCFLGLAT
jgi:hypothetical protein